MNIISNRHKNEVRLMLLVWNPRKGERSRGCLATSYIGYLECVTGLPKDTTPVTMEQCSE